MNLRPKKFYSSGYKLIFNIIALHRETFFVFIDEFVDACGIPHRVLLFDSLPLRGLLLIFVHPVLNLCTHQFTVNFCYNILYAIYLFIYTAFSYSAAATPDCFLFAHCWTYTFLSFFQCLRSWALLFYMGSTTFLISSSCLFAARLFRLLLYRGI